MSMPALLRLDTSLCVESLSSQSMTEPDYRRAVVEFDHLWETEMNHDREHRMMELLQQIEDYERTNRASGK
jgi:hypothetical protein